MKQFVFSAELENTCNEAFLSYLCDVFGVENIDLVNDIVWVWRESKLYCNVSVRVRTSREQPWGGTRRYQLVYDGASLYIYQLSLCGVRIMTDGEKA